MMKQLPSLLRKYDIDEIATIVDCDNWQSYDAHKSLGYERIGIIFCVRIFGWHLHAYRPANRFWQPLPPAIGSVEIT